MYRLISLLLVGLFASPAWANVSRQTVIVVLGAPGNDQYAAEHRTWLESWRQAAEAGGANFAEIGAGDTAENDRERLFQVLNEQREAEIDVLWLVLIGHGTFDGQSAKFNLRGPDVTAAELAEKLAPLAMTTAVINCTSSSGPFINALSGPNRVVVTATKSGYELNYARFGGRLAAAIRDDAADLDKDGQTSLLEAYLTACRRVKEFYDSESRLMTEHALLDDNGDGRGTPAEWFRGTRAVVRTADGAELDGLYAHQLHLVASDRENQMPREVRQRRDDLERQVAALREKKQELSLDDYYLQLEQLMLSLAKIYDSVEEEESKKEEDSGEVESAAN